MSVRQPGTAAGRTGLDRLLATPARTLLASDYDGTLAPIVDDPAAAYAAPGSVAALGRLARRLAGVAVVTGRPVQEALRLGGLAGAEGLDALHILGQYGVERWDAGSGEVTAPAMHPGVEAARRALPDLLARHDLSEVHVEDKGRALALHLRRLPDPDRALDRLRTPVHDLAARHDLVVEPGKLVLELRAPGMDKGAAVEQLLQGTAIDTVVYVGDDLGDLAAFDAVDRLRGIGGAGLLVCVQSADAAERTDLDDRADLLLESPAALVGWLDALADTLDEAADPATDRG